MLKQVTITDYFSALPSDVKGSIFEKSFCKWFLENDPRYASRLKKVWLWCDWPGNWGIDKGIDLIAETHEGEIWAIQAKAYEASYSITKEDVDRFLSESSRKQINFRLLIATTNHMGANSNEVIQGQEKPVGLCLADALNASVLDINDFINHRFDPKKKEHKKPRKHQEEALKDILTGFKQVKRGQLHMACGTGKTLMGLWLAQRLSSRTTLVLAPSISLLGQLFQEWINNCSETFKFSPLFVCSDKTVGAKGADATYLHESIVYLGFPVTTDVDQLYKSYTATPGNKVIFCTYQSSEIIKKLCERDPNVCFDLTIADEAHRCAGKGNSEFAVITDIDAIRANHILFMTATPKIFSERLKKTAESYEYELVSMDDYKKFGPVFHRLPFSKAIQLGLLSDYQIIISVMDNKLYQEYAERGRFVTLNKHETDARTLASQVLVARAIKKYGLTKMITFHNSRSNARDFIQNLSVAVEMLEDAERPIIGYRDLILGEMPQSQRIVRLHQFKANGTGCTIVGNVKCLSEGIDVPTLDGIAFIDPKGSEVDIVQSVGRVMRRSQSAVEKKGVIIIPIFVDSSTDDEEALEQSCFRPIGKVLKALRAHDDLLAEELDSLRLELGKRAYKELPKLKKIVLDLPVNIDVDFAESIQLRVISGGAKIWWPFGDARQFVHQLQLKTSKDWQRYVMGELPHLIQRPEDIPKAPKVVYEGKGWVGWGDFLGSRIIASQNRVFRSFKDARVFAHTFKFSSKAQWYAWAKTNARPNDIPADPQAAYAKNGWTDWGDFLGTGIIAPQKRQFRLFDVAKEYARSLKLKGQKEWQIFVQTSARPQDIPTNPDKIYAKMGWKGWGDFLGTGNIAKMRREFKPFEDARDYVRSRKFKNIQEFRAWAKTADCPPDIPHCPNETYANKGWKGNRDWLEN